MAIPSETHALIAAAMVAPPRSVADYLLVLPVVVPTLFGAGLVLLRERPKLQAAIAMLALALGFAADAALLLRVAADGPLVMIMGGWKPPFGIAFTLDLAGALFLVTAGLAALCCGVHALAAVPREERRHGFFPLLLLMTAGVSGAFLTGDVFNLYVWFEVMLIASFGLLILGSTPVQIDGATKYAFLNLVATTLFLVAAALLYGRFGTLNMADLAAKAGGPTEGTTLTLAALFFVAFAMKAGAAPVNAWLPASYHTPRFVVSALFAGLLTKVGLYAMLRVPIMLLPAERAVLAPLVGWVAALTMLLGALGALAQSDLRRLLNHLVIAGIGTALTGIAVASEAGLGGTILYALHSIVAMCGLYLVGGVAARRAGTSSLHEMGGLWRRYPAFSLAALALLLAVAGLPPFSGFWPKLVLVRAAVAEGVPWLAAAILLSSLLVLVAVGRVFSLVFWRARPARSGRGETEDFMAPPPDRVYAAVPVYALVAVVMAAGILPEWPMRLSFDAAQGLLDPSAYRAAVFGETP